MCPPSSSIVCVTDHPPAADGSGPIVAQAEQFIADIRNEIEDNEDLVRDFGNLMGSRVWNSGRIVTANGIHIVGKGANQKLRGIKYNNTRPDIVIIDDLENDENVATREETKVILVVHEGIT